MGKTRQAVKDAGNIHGCQPKTLFAGSDFGLSKTVSPPVRSRPKTDGAAEPACSGKRRVAD